MKTEKRNQLIALLSTNSIEFIPAAYRTFLNRDADYEGALFYSQKLTAGIPKERIARDLLQSKECSWANDDIRNTNHLLLGLELSRIPFVGWTLIKLFPALRYMSEAIQNAERSTASSTVALPTPESRNNSKAVSNVIQGSNAQSFLEGQSSSLAEYGHFPHSPLISILIVSYNSANDLRDLLPSLKKQTYSNFEIILVENGTVDTSHILRSVFPEAKYIQSAANMGFAEGNNIASRHSKGEFLALINPDTIVDPDWLFEMLDALWHDSNAAVAVPKIRFYTRFIDLVFTTDGNIRLDLASIEQHLKYNKWFNVVGIRESSSSMVSQCGTIHLRLPLDESTLDIELELTDCSYISVTLGRRQLETPQIAAQNSQRIRQPISLTNASATWARWMINNAGSSVGADGPYDRGYGEFDEGQFDQKCYVEAFCGCAALIRRQAVLSRDIFVRELFAYYEDSELSAYLRSTSSRIIYTPRSNVYHKHSVSSKEGSPVWNVLVGRSRLIYNYLTGSCRAPIEVVCDELDNIVNSEIPPALEAVLRTLNQDFRQRHMQSSRQPRRIAVYNSYWNTLGGGELHALSIGLALSANAKLYLISESDFDISRLGEYFGLNLSECQKLICPVVTTALTSQFDVFVNSTYRSNLVSAAHRSYYVVSFPHKDVEKSFLNSYIFLHNSEYTRKWACAYWGPHANEVLLPILQFAHCNVDVQAVHRTKTFLTIGRFNPNGHCKNQHIIIQAFLAAQQLSPAKDWKLILVGSYNPHSTAERDYFSDLQALSTSSNIEIIPNCPKGRLDELIASSSVYIHATGYGKSALTEPHLHEHFGITPFEAFLHGVMPLVYAYGGPKEMVTEADVGLTFYSFDELVDHMSQILAGKIEIGSRDDMYKMMCWAKRKIEDAHIRIDEICTGIILSPANVNSDLPAILET